MNQTHDIRSYLQYVPRFRDKIFVVEIDWAVSNEAQIAEVMMDLKSLQSVGVRLLVCLDQSAVTRFFELAVDLEISLASAPLDWSKERVIEVLGRRQLAVLERKAGLLDPSLTQLAAQIKASKVLVLSKKIGLQTTNGVVKFLHYSDVPKDDTLLVRAAEACRQGVPRVHLLNLDQPSVMLSEVFSTEGVGTMIHADSYREIRPLREEDISELLAMIGRSIKESYLVSRNYEDIRDHLSDYYVLEVDETIVGCGALYEYKNRAEIACLYVKQNREGTGYGAEMVRFLEAKAAEKKMSEVFAISMTTGNYFTQRLGYVPMALEDLPESRLSLLKQSNRASKAYCKVL